MIFLVHLHLRQALFGGYRSNMWNSVPDHERLRLWKELRISLENLTVEEQLTQVSSFFSSCPIGSRSMDYYDPDTWPSPWEIIYYSSLCVNSISLLIYYTIRLVNPTLLVELILVRDDCDTYLLPRIENQFVLNYELGAVSSVDDIENCFDIRQVFTSEQIAPVS